MLRSILLEIKKIGKSFQIKAAFIALTLLSLLHLTDAIKNRLRVEEGILYHLENPAFGGFSPVMFAGSYFDSILTAVDGSTLYFLASLLSPWGVC